MSSANRSRPLSLLSLYLALALAGGCGDRLGRIRVKDADTVVSYPATGGVVISASRAPDRKAICVAPPAQGAMNIDLNIKHDGKVNVLKYVEVETQNALGLTKNLASLYEQNERTLFLQFSLYRLCEAYANGMLDEETYGEAMARESLQLKRAAAEAETLLAEATAVEAQASLAKAAVQPTYEAGLKKLAKAEEQLETAKAGAAPGRVTTAGKAVKAQDGSGQEVLEDAKKAVEDAKKYLATDEWKSVQKKMQDAADAAKALAQARAKAEGARASSKYAVELANDALMQQTALLADAMDRDGDLNAARQRMSRRNYERLFERVLTTAETLAKQQVEIAKAEAEKAKIEAEAQKAKADAEKAKNSDEAKKLSEKFEELQDALVKAAVHRASGCGDKCESPTRDGNAGSAERPGASRKAGE